MINTVIILACLLIGALFGRALLSIVRWTIALAILAASLRGLALLLPELSRVDWPSIGLGALGGVGAMLIGFRAINNLLVNRDRSNDHQGVDKKHDARLI